MWPLLLLVGVAAAAGQSPPAGADGQKLEAAWASLRARHARDYAIATPNGIDESRYVEVGGIQQWITIRGEDKDNPVLLFLHGGPGDAINPWGYAGFRLWVKHFTVVQWDQRGAGRTFGKNPDAPLPAMTLARMTQDGIELADVLRKQLRKNKIVSSANTRSSAPARCRTRPPAIPWLMETYCGRRKCSRMSAPYESCARLVRRHIRTAAGTACSASGRICSKARTRSSSRW